MGRCPSQTWSTCCHLLFLLAERGQGSRRLRALPCLSLPHPTLSLQLRFGPRCPKPKCSKLLVKTGLRVASAGPAADLPLASSTLVGPAAGVCPQVLPTGKPGLTLGRENVLATLKGRPAQGWALLQRAPG
uniref:Uncharacterized protein n=1 Tax=Molossus molossus TaxID=27622 RepID=A0A7J8I100_MOLMO|nr:hypothetical protein HJG59_010833 [Molossus molossus]